MKSTSRKSRRTSQPRRLYHPRLLENCVLEIYGQQCVISADAQIGKGTRVGNFVFIRDNTVIGENCLIGSYVDIEGDVLIGDFVSLQSGCYLTRGVVIENDAFCVRAS